MVKGRKVKSAAALRARLVAWCEAHGGREISPGGHNSILGGEIGATWRVPLQVGALVVHLPYDSEHGYHVHTRFTEGAPLPREANQYSGKWNHYEASEGALYDSFTGRVARYVATHATVEV